MTGFWNWFAAGGYTMIALGVVGVVLGFLILERFLATGAPVRALSSPGSPGRRRGKPGAPAALAGLRRMGLIRACIVAAPLLGLLGTVSGLIEAFDSILRGGYVAQMSGAICKALATTQYGLAIAAPGLLAERILIRRQEKLAAGRRAAGPSGREGA